jgi:penicillin-binding protein 1B
MARGRDSKSKGGSTPRPWLRRAGFVLLAVGFVGGMWAAHELLALDRVVRSRFEGRRFSVPSRVYAAPKVIFTGADWERLDLNGWLARTGYREQNEAGPLAVGYYRSLPGRLRVHLRAFDHPDIPEPDRRIEFRLEAGRVREMRDERGQPVDVVTLEPEQISAFYDESREQRDLVAMKEVPAHLVAAIFAIEDRRFEEHNGVDLRRIVGALLANLRAGGIREGGSTLTQQLVKNFFLTPERTLRRKLTEAVMALLVEARYSKPQILEAYLNEIYLGRRGSTAIHGVGEASRFFFGKRVPDLTLDESALIAAVIQSPNAMSPHRHPERAKKRRDLVLDQMEEQGRITAEEAEAARNRPLSLAAVTLESGQDRYFLDMLQRQLPEVYHEELLASEGLRIYSTLDTGQRAAVLQLRKGLVALEKQLPKPKVAKGETPPALQGCLLAMRPQTGEILALVGGRDYGTSQFNRCTQARRQAGSVFKPIVYAAALSRQSGPVVTLASFVPDEPIEVDTPSGPWRPLNYDRQYRGPVSVRVALEDSLNVPAARLGQAVGIRRVVEMAQKLGIESPLPAVPSLALGSAEVSPLEIATVYATFANGGLRPTARSFTGLLDDHGLAQAQSPLAGSRRVLDSGTAYLVTSLLEGVVDRGTGAAIRSRGVRGPVAGKTGTTDDENDLWFVGFTPELVVAVWVGFDEPRKIGVPASRGALPIWADYLMAISGGQIRGAFMRPREIESVDIDPLTGERALWGCPRTQSEYFLIGTAPVETCPRGMPSFPRFFERFFGG